MVIAFVYPASKLTNSYSQCPNEIRASPPHRAIGFKIKPRIFTGLREAGLTYLIIIPLSPLQFQDNAQKFGLIK